MWHFDLPEVNFVRLSCHKAKIQEKDRYLQSSEKGSNPHPGKVWGDLQTQIMGRGMGDRHPDTIKYEKSIMRYIIIVIMSYTESQVYLTYLISTII